MILSDGKYKHDRHYIFRDVDVDVHSIFFGFKHIVIKLHILYDTDPSATSRCSRTLPASPRSSRNKSRLMTST